MSRKCAQQLEPFCQIQIFISWWVVNAFSTKDVEIMWYTTESILEVPKGFKITYQDYYSS